MHVGFLESLLKRLILFQAVGGQPERLPSFQVIPKLLVGDQEIKRNFLPIFFGMNFYRDSSFQVFVEVFSKSSHFPPIEFSGFWDLLIILSFAGIEHYT